MVEIESLNQGIELVKNLRERYRRNSYDSTQEFSKGGKNYMLLAQSSGKFVVVGGDINHTLLEEATTIEFIMSL